MRFLYTFLFMGAFTFAQAQIKSPEEFLVSDYGKHFTPHHLLVDYAYYLAEASPYMSLERYGYTNEKRPLLLATFTSPTNQEKVEDIRKTNMHNVGYMTTQDYVPTEMPILWLSFGVHGNEAGGPESSMTVMYKLANPDGPTQEMLNNAIILLDPSVNPDGYNRYTNWVRQVAGKHPHPDVNDREHMEPWPGGRVNHYLFDLNRDWAWQTQIETQQRMEVYNQWMPHIHVDFHEMGHNSHYYFAPAAKPYHDYITDWQREFQVTIGKNHARYFDKEGWMYFTRESFDLFYPSYGDTYPTFNGAIGMTYEKGGHSRAGRAIDMNNGDILTLQDRIDHHTTTAMSTIEAAVDNKANLISNFKKYFSDAVNAPKGKFKGYVIKKSLGQSELASLLERNRIEFSYSSENNKTSGYNYFTQKNEAFSIEPGDIIIDVVQPKSTLIQVLLEPEHMLEDSITYDITAWSLPYAYGVQTYGLSKSLSVNGSTTKEEESAFECEGLAYAYFIEWSGKEAHQATSELLKKGIHLRRANKSAEFDDQKIDRAFLVAIRGDNKHIKDFDKTVRGIIEPLTIKKGCLESGFSLNGMDLGGRNFSLVENPRVLTIAGDGVGTNAMGQVWHYFESYLDYPLSIVDIDNINRIDWDVFDVVILPDGYYNLSSNQLNQLKEWVREGGKLIAIGNALRMMADVDGFALQRYATDDEKRMAERAREEMQLRERLESFEGQERRSMRNSIPGAIVRNEVDKSHPLAFGLGADYYSLKTSRSNYQLLKGALNIIYVPAELVSYGFIGTNLKKQIPETVSFAVENQGRGTIIYMVDNPLYRGFWNSGLHLFTNALFLVD